MSFKKDFTGFDDSNSFQRRNCCPETSVGPRGCGDRCSVANFVRGLARPWSSRIGVHGNQDVGFRQSGAADPASLDQAGPAARGDILSLAVLQICRALAVADEGVVGGMPQVACDCPAKNRGETKSQSAKSKLQVAVFQSPADEVLVEAVHAVEIRPPDPDIVAAHSRTHRTSQQLIPPRTKGLHRHAPPLAPRNPRQILATSQSAVGDLFGGVTVETIAVAQYDATLSAIIKVTTNMILRQDAITVSEQQVGGLRDECRFVAAKGQSKTFVGMCRVSDGEVHSPSKGLHDRPGHVRRSVVRDDDFHQAGDIPLQLQRQQRPPEMIGPFVSRNQDRDLELLWHSTSWMQLPVQWKRIRKNDSKSLAQSIRNLTIAQYRFCDPTAKPRIKEPIWLSHARGKSQAIKCRNGSRFVIGWHFCLPDERDAVLMHCQKSNLCASIASARKRGFVLEILQACAAPMSKHRQPVLVTGAGGFIGSHLVELLLKEGYRVRALLRYTSRASAGDLAEVIGCGHPNLELCYGDVRVAADVLRAAEGCLWIFHLAALIGIPYSYVSPASYIDVNVVGTLNVLEAARQLGIERTMMTSTSEVYGSARTPTIDEEHPLSAQSPYAASKIGADQLAISYQRSFGLPVSIVRPFNTFGPRQSLRALIPTICAQAKFRGSLRLGNLATIRDFVFVQDTVAGFLAVARSDSLVGQVTNLATGRGIRVSELVDLVRGMVGADLPVEVDQERVRPADSEVNCLIGNAAKARAEAGWIPQTTFEDGLAQTLDWVGSHFSGHNLEAYQR